MFFRVAPNKGLFGGVRWVKFELFSGLDYKGYCSRSGDAMLLIGHVCKGDRGTPRHVAEMPFVPVSNLNYIKLARLCLIKMVANPKMTQFNLNISKQLKL